MSLCGPSRGRHSLVRTYAAAGPRELVQIARRTAAPRPISAVPTSTIVASSRIAGIPEPARWTATGEAAVTDDSSVAADEDPEAVVASANPASVSVTSCLRITVGSSPRLSTRY